MDGFSDFSSAPADAECRESGAFDRLARLVHEVTGFRDGSAFRGKLGTILGGTDEDTASTWLRRLGRLLPGSGEWQSVIERLLVTDTSFFRDGPQLDVLRHRVLPEMVERKRCAGYRDIRCWSAGCSSGEEPYTLAMLVLDALVAAGEATEMEGGGVDLAGGWMVHVLGTDISGRAVEQAMDGIYTDFGRSPLGETPPHFHRFFVRRGGDETIVRYGLRKDVRAVTSFGLHNLVDGAVGGGFDLVCCRNVMVHFDEAGRSAALDSLAEAVRADGYLMVGPTDLSARPPGFAPVDARVSPVLTRNRPAGEP